MQYMQSKPFSVQCPRKRAKKSDSGTVGKAQVLDFALKDPGVLRHGMSEPDVTPDYRTFSNRYPAEYRRVGINGDIVFEDRMPRFLDRMALRVI